MAIQIELPYEDVNFRSFSGMEPTDVMAAFRMQYNQDPEYVDEWLVRFIWEGKDDDPVVEFYSLDTNQFVSSYYWSTMMEHNRGYGLCLDGGVRAWNMTALDFDDVLDWMLDEGCQLTGNEPSDVLGWAENY